MVSKNMLSIILFCASHLMGSAQSTNLAEHSFPFKLYPLLNDNRPDIPSPLISSSGEDYVLAVNREDKYAVIRVTPGNTYDICPQLVIDSSDFPELAATGLHGEDRLNQIRTITGRSLDEITRLGRPNGLSQAGFLSTDEDLISVLKSDNRLVRQMGLTHPELARPLFHVLNMMDADLSLNRWNMAIHKWDHIRYFYYNDQKIYVEAEDTKGGQQSIFNDGIEGAFYIKLWRDLNPDEQKYLEKHYNFLTDNEFEKFTSLLTTIHTGEMQPQYIMRYGFYEGHTFWRADPITLSLLFGIKDLQDLDQIFDHKLYDLLTKHFK